MIRLLLAVMVICAPALARDNGQYENVSPDVRAWFRSQKSPKTGALCCSEADGLYAEEDIREGHYWTRWGGREWQPVPDEVVIQHPNPHGAPVVWWYVEKGEIKIRCYAPGSGV
jgi:hypothetical protein